MKLVARIGPLLIMVVLLWVSAAPTFGQTRSGKIPHLAYGESREFTLERTPTLLWLDVRMGDVFSWSAWGGQLTANYLSIASIDFLEPFNWLQSEAATIAVYTADYPGPYLLTLAGEGTITVTLEQGDTLSVDRGPIGFGDTVTGMGSETSVDAYSIDLPPDSEFTLRLETEGFGIPPILLLPSLYETFRISQTDDRVYSVSYEIPAELAGTHQILVRLIRGDYTLTVIEGDALSLDKGMLALDTPVSGTGTAGTYDRYTFAAAQDDYVTFVMESPAGWYAEIDPRAANGGTFSLLGSGGTDGGYYHTYSVHDAGPYALYVRTDSDYTLRMLNGPYVEGLPSIHIGDSLEVAAYAPADYVLEAAEGTWITIQTIADDGMSINNAQVLDSTGNWVNVVAEREDSTRGIYQSLVRLAGPAPYLLSIFAESDLTFSVVEGDQVRKSAGEIGVGQVIEGRADDGQVIFYTLPSVEEGQSVAIVSSGPSFVGLFDGEGRWVERSYYVYVSSGDPLSNIIHAVYEVDGVCPCDVQLMMNLPNYRVEVMPLTADMFPEPQLIAFGKAVNGDAGNAWDIPYTFEATTDGDLIIELKFDPTLTEVNSLDIDVIVPREDYPRSLQSDGSQTESGEGYIVMHYPLFFPGEYTLSIKNLVGPYTLTVTLQ